MKRRMLIPGVVLALMSLAAMPGAVRADRSTENVAAGRTTAEQLDFGPNVKIFDPSMPTSEIQATVDAIASQQVDNEMGPQRFALLFKPGTYGTATQPLDFQVGYYTDVAGLGASPTDVTINGHIDVYNRCLGPDNCIALDNFWRSLSNLTINVKGLSGCRASADLWAVSQAAPLRRVNITGGNLTLMDYCSGPSFASGGFIADSRAGTIINGSQQQFYVRDSSIDKWTNGVWNQVFSGVIGAPPQCFPAQKSCGGPYTTLATSPVTREKPFLYVDPSGHYNVFVPALRRQSVGTTWANRPTAGSSIPISRFFIAKPSDSVHEINAALSRGMNLIFTPGIYHLDQTIKVKRADSLVLGLGFPTLVPDDGVVAMSVADVAGVKLAGLLFDAGPVNSPVLLEVGTKHGEGNGNQNDGNSDSGNQNDGNTDPGNQGNANSDHGNQNDRTSGPGNPTSLQDVFFRIGGATPGKATTSLIVNSNNVLLDDIWAWRADHGAGVGWTSNTADTGLIVNGDNVTAYGLFVEHFQKYEVIWNGNHGTVIFFQNEMPYDPPNQAAWMEAPGVDGWAAFKVADTVTSFAGYGMGSYSFFNQGVTIYAAHAFEVPATLPPSSLHDLLTVFLSTAGSGGILHVVNDTGGSSTIANPDTPVTVVSYP
ncbi:MAG: discoidin domain-containing protein [Chloroflexota bacterium]